MSSVAEPSPKRDELTEQDAVLPLIEEESRLSKREVMTGRMRVDASCFTQRSLEPDALIEAASALASAPRPPRGCVRHDGTGRSPRP